MQATLTTKMGERLKAARINAGMSRANVAERLKISVTAISYWERGETVPTVENLVELAKIYRKTIDWLVGVETKKNPINYTISYRSNTLS